MTSAAPGPAALVLSATVARRYYVDGRSKVQIGDELGLSRFKVARLLDLARETGLVRIEIGHPGAVDVDLSARLRERFGLERAVVVVTRDDASTLRAQVGQVAAELLAEVVVPEDVLGVAWARSVGAMAKFLPRLPTVPVVQLTGAVALPGGGDTSFDIVRDVARAAGGPAYVFYAPIVLPDGATAATMRSQSDIARAFEHAATITKAIVGIGQCEPGESTLYDAVSEADHDELRRLGVVGEVCGVFVDGDGEPVDTALASRVMTIGAERLLAVPDVLAIVYGTGKLLATRAVLRSGLVSSLVTSQGLARALLEQA